MIQLLSQRHIHIQAIHIPGVINSRADWLSRHPTHNDYQLDRTVYHQVCSQLHYYPDTDLFASRQNRLCKQYCSWQTDPRSMGNAWSIHWGKLKGWINAPHTLIPRCLAKIQSDKAKVMICVPEWTTAKWWSTLQSMICHRHPTQRYHHQAIFHTQEGAVMQDQRWATHFLVVQG